MGENFSSRDRVFYCCSLAGALQEKSGYVRWLRPDAALTLSPVRQAIWLALRVHAPESAVQGAPNSLNSRARLWIASKSTQKMPVSLSASCSMIEHIFPLTLKRVLRLGRITRTGKPETTKLCDGGEQFTASRCASPENFQNLNTTPAFSGRVFLSGLGRGSPEEYGGEQIAVCGGAR
jgi:hypothetical protein